MIITLFYVFDFHITGSSASAPVHNSENIIYVKDEPVEVGYSFL